MWVDLQWHWRLLSFEGIADILSRSRSEPALWPNQRLVCHIKVGFASPRCLGWGLSVSIDLFKTLISNLWDLCKTLETCSKEIVAAGDGAPNLIWSHLCPGWDVALSVVIIKNQGTCGVWELGLWRLPFGTTSRCRLPDSMNFPLDFTGLSESNLNLWQSKALPSSGLFYIVDALLWVVFDRNFAALKGFLSLDAIYSVCSELVVQRARHLWAVRETATSIFSMLLKSISKHLTS